VVVDRVKYSTKLIYYGQAVKPGDQLLSLELIKVALGDSLSVNSTGQTDFVIYLDLSPKSILRSLAIPRRKKILVIFEPNAVNPLQHKRLIQNLFGLVLVHSIKQKKSTNIFVQGGGWNPDRNFPNMSTILAADGVACAFGNKVSLSKTSQYSLRRDVMAKLLNSGVQVHLAGLGWGEKFSVLKGYLASFSRVLLSAEIPQLKQIRRLEISDLQRYPNFRYVGWVDNEVDHYRSSACVLVIENDSEFLSEKLFHAISSGRPVVYCGPQEFPWMEQARVFYCPPDPKVIRDRVLWALSAFKSDSRRSPDPSIETDLEVFRNSNFYERIRDEICAYVEQA
jgi:hypothetical protein